MYVINDLINTKRTKIWRFTDLSMLSGPISLRREARRYGIPRFCVQLVLFLLYLLPVVIMIALSVLMMLYPFEIANVQFSCNSYLIIEIRKKLSKFEVSKVDRKSGLKVPLAMQQNLQTISQLDNSDTANNS